MVEASKFRPKNRRLVVMELFDWRHESKSKGLVALLRCSTTEWHSTFSGERVKGTNDRVSLLSMNVILDDW